MAVGVEEYLDAVLRLVGGQSRAGGHRRLHGGVEVLHPEIEVQHLLLRSASSGQTGGT